MAGMPRASIGRWPKPEGLEVRRSDPPETGRDVAVSDVGGWRGSSRPGQPDLDRPCRPGSGSSPRRRTRSGCTRSLPRTSSRQREAKVHSSAKSSTSSHSSPSARTGARSRDIDFVLGDGFPPLRTLTLGPHDGTPAAPGRRAAAERGAASSAPVDSIVDGYFRCSTGWATRSTTCRTRRPAADAIHLSAFSSRRAAHPHPARAGTAAGLRPADEPPRLTSSASRTRSFRDVYDHLIRLNDELDSFRARRGLPQIYLSTINNNPSTISEAAHRGDRHPRRDRGDRRHLRDERGGIRAVWRGGPGFYIILLVTALGAPRRHVVPAQDQLCRAARHGRLVVPDHLRPNDLRDPPNGHPAPGPSAGAGGDRAARCAGPPGGGGSGRGRRRPSGGRTGNPVEPAAEGAEPVRLGWVSMPSAISQAQRTAELTTPG
jgi:hypothetical protein